MNFNHGRGHGQDRDRRRGINNYYFRGGRSYNPNSKRTTQNEIIKEKFHKNKNKMMKKYATDVE